MLRELIEHHQVCYEVWPEWEMVDGRRVQVGFELDLCAATPDEDPDHAPFESLKELADSVLHTGPDAAEFQIQPFDNSIHESPRRGFRPEVVLSVHIAHEHGPDEEVDDREQQFLHEVESRLHALGVPRAN